MLIKTRETFLSTCRPSSKAAENTRKKPLRKQLLSGQMEEEEREEDDEDEQDPASKKPGTADSVAHIRKQRVTRYMPLELFQLLLLLVHCSVVSG